jgi:hypothetical protein
MVFDEGKSLSTQAQQYDITSIINQVRQAVDTWRSLPNPASGRSRPRRRVCCNTGGTTNSAACARSSAK